VLVHAFIRFNKGLLKLHVQWQVWLMVLVAANMIVPLFFLGRFEAQVVLGTTMMGMILMTILTALTGFSRLLGLGHLPWLALLVIIWGNLDQLPVDDFYGLWLRAVLVLNSISLVVDTIDVVRYILGDREETVPGL